ncbi:MAG: HPP family protein [Alphaproteobacteria bacterium]|nr:HPP family protein [Alphaproteobacteria bacterium]
MRSFFQRHQPSPTVRQIGLAALGAFLAVAAIAAAHAAGPLALLIPPFGASCALLFAAPGSPLAQPSAVIGGHLVSTLSALLLRAALPDVWWAAALAVAVAVALMMALRVLHPPGAADPLVVFALDPGFGFLLAPVLVGAVGLVAMAALYHRATGTTYPTPKL